MAKIIPFKAVRPTRDKVSLVASRSYQSYTIAQRQARLNDNPFSFLHIVNPGYRYTKEVSGTERYQLVKNRFLEFKEEKIFKQETKPCYYSYKIIDRDEQEFKGIVAAISAEDYKKNVIKKHEETLQDKEIIFKNYLKTVGFNAEPVLIIYEDQSEIDAIQKTVQSERAEYEFTTTYRDTHYLWPISDDKKIAKITQLFKNINNLYIADGHHRTASSYLLYEDEKKINKSHSGSEAYNFFMAFLLPESQLKVHEFNRLVKDLNGLTKEEFLIKLDTVFRIENRGKTLFKPKEKHQFNMYLGGEFYSLNLRKNTFKVESPLDELDAYILYKTVLKPLLNISDLRNDNRISYSNGKTDIVQVINSIDSGEYAVSFGMYPATINNIKNIADAGLKMPPKSTYVEPKLRSGVTIYEY